MTEPDADLARLLGRSVERIPAGDPDAALAAVTGRSRVRRRRRAAARAGAIVAAVGAVAVVWLMAGPPERSQVDTVDSPTSPSSVATTPAPSAVPTTAPAATVPSSAPSTIASPTTSVVPTAPPSAAPGSTAAPTATPPAPPTAPSTAPISTTPPSSGPRTWSGVGGAVTVRLDAGSLVLVSANPIGGYVITEQKVAADEIEVRFEDSTSRTRIRVRLDHGQLVGEVQEEGSGTSGT
jgi:hypothetical protein